MIAVCGVKNSGKTTLIERLLPKLSALGIKTAVIKHDGHDFEADVPGTDSYRHFAAGACGVAVYSSEKVSIVRRTANATAQKLAECFPEADMILCEGQKNSDMPKLEVVRRELSTRPVCQGREVLGYVTDVPLKARQAAGWKDALPVFGMEDTDAVAAFIAGYCRSVM